MRNTITLSLASLLTLQAIPAEAGPWFHATRKAVAKRVLQQGIEPRFMKATARFGKGAYFGLSRATALAEKPGGQVLKFRGPARLERKALDTRRKSPLQLCRIAGLDDCRGAVKKGIVGPGLGQTLGEKAAKQNRIIKYRSRRNPHGRGDVFVPERVYRKNRKAIHPER